MIIQALGLRLAKASDLGSKISRIQVEIKRLRTVEARLTQKADASRLHLNPSLADLTIHVRLRSEAPVASKADRAIDQPLSPGESLAREIDELLSSDEEERKPEARTPLRPRNTSVPTPTLTPRRATAGGRGIRTPQRVEAVKRAPASASASGGPGAESKPKGVVESLKVHAFRLVLESPYFEKALMGSFREGSERVIEVELEDREGEFKSRVRALCGPPYERSPDARAA